MRSGDAGGKRALGRMMGAVIGWAWWILLLVVWATSAWGLIEAARTDRIAVSRDWGFSRKTEPFEFWFLAACYLIVVVGVAWILADGWSPLLQGLSWTN